jgi:hypothetical protein
MDKLSALEAKFKRSASSDSEKSAEASSSKPIDLDDIGIKVG